MPKPLLLPKPDEKNHLSTFGYSLTKKKQSRHSSLKRASKKYGTLQVLKRVNLIRNITRPDLQNKKKLTTDVNYMKKLYQKEKKSTKKSTKK